MIRVLYADERHLEDRIVEAISNSDIQITGQVITADEVLNNIKKEQPDVLILTPLVGGSGVFEVIDRVRLDYPRIGILFMIYHADGYFPKRLLEIGARGFVTYKTNAIDIIEAIKVVQSGGLFVSSEIAQKLALSLLPTGGFSPFDRLSEREMQIILFLYQRDNLQDAKCIGLSPKALITYKNRILDKIRVDDFEEVFALARSHGLIQH